MIKKLLDDGADALGNIVVRFKDNDGTPNPPDIREERARDDS